MTAQILRNNQELQSLLEALPDALVVSSARGEIVLINAQLEKLFGYQRGELLGKSTDLLAPDRFRKIHAAHREGFLACPQARVMGDSPEVFGLRKDGTEFSAEITLNAVETEDGFLVSAAVRDITERRKAEHELRHSHNSLQSLFESLPGLFLILTPDLTIISASDAYLEAAMRKRGDLIGRCIFDAFPDNPDDPTADGVANLSASFGRVLQTGAADRMAIQKYDIRRPDGSFEQRYWCPINSAVRAVDDRIEYVIHRVEDVTEFMRQTSQPADGELRARMQQMEAEIFKNSQELHAANLKLQEANAQLLRAKAQAEAGNRAKSAFLSTMSHEIRTPMNAILGYAQLMLRDPTLNREAVENLRIIDKSGEHLLTLIDAVLDMSKIEAGRTVLNPVTFSLVQLVDDLAAMFRLRAEQKALGFDIEVEGESSLPYLVADQGKIRQILVNLLGNAIKFTESGLISLRVSLRQEESGGLTLAAEVRDTGIGIAESDQEKLFEPFNQVRRGNEGLKGTGLGLAISRKYARLMGGDISVRSVPGAGSSFQVEIPIERGDARVAVGPNSPVRVTRIRAGAEIPRILIADDLVENRDWLIKLLASIGYAVRGADNGESALQTWREWQPHLILMDVNMPVMDGLTATRAIKSDPRGAATAIVALTAGVLDDDRKTIFDSGADDFLAKPCREEELFRKIAGFLNIIYEYEEASTDCPDRPVEGVTGLEADPSHATGPHNSEIMIVDDNPANLQLLESMLRRQGHQVRAVSRGKQALAEAFAHPPDLILLDKMPDMSGYEVCERLKCSPHTSGIPVIFLSGMTATPDKVRAFRAGAVDYIAKPFQFEEVQARAETHLKLHNLQRELQMNNERLEEAVAVRTCELHAANERLVASEERLRLSLLSAAIGTWEANIETGKRQWDEQSKSIFGLPPHFAIEPEAVFLLIHPEDRDRVRLAVQAGLDPTGTGRYEMDYRVNALGDGSLRYIHAQGQTYFEGEGSSRHAVRAVGTFENITERKLAEVKLKRSLQEKQALLQEIHHRVKNNLQIVSSLLAMQATEVDDPRALVKLADSERRIKSMALIHEHLYRQEDLNSIDLAEYVGDLASRLFSSCEKNPLVTYRLDVSPARLAIEQAIPCGLILNELITNALKYAYPVGPGEISIVVSMDGQELRMAVSDSGVGLPANFDETRTLGMTIVRVLTEQLEGRLEIGGSVGASFTVCFTCSRASQNGSSQNGNDKQSESSHQADY